MNISSWPKPACAVCGSTMGPHRHEWVLRCSRCGTLASSLAVDIPDRPGAAILDEGLREAGLAATRGRNNARLLSAIAALQPGPRLLDVGCGPGFLLADAAAAGFTPEGIEPDADVLATARTRGLVRQGYFPSAVTPDELWDVIVFNDVLEHIPDVDGAIQAAAAHLSPGGVLALNCPDRRGLFFGVADVADRCGLHGPYDRLWQRGLPSPHVWYFTPDNLAEIADRHGFTTAGQVRLSTIEIDGLWQRISYVRGQPLALSLAAYAFAVAVWPVHKVAPADAMGCLFRRG